jgi:hypothetical protein
VSPAEQETRNHGAGARREPAPPAPRCRRCGEPIGTYERLACELPDGSMVTSGLLVLPQEVRRLGGDAVLLHLACHSPLTSPSRTAA